jgi:RimJ/RimL family protein N-acetyltransferase
MSQPNISNPAYRIETARLVVRCYKPTDAQLLADSITENIEHLKPWMPWAHVEPTPFEAKLERVNRYRGLFDLQSDYVYGIFNEPETQQFGGTGLHTRVGDDQLEIGYWIHKDFVNQGLATEVSAALVKVAFEIIHVHRIEIHCDPGNAGSASIPRKLGFTHEGTLRAKTRFLDRWSDSMIWALLKEDYLESPACKAEIRVFDSRGIQLL